MPEVQTVLCHCGSDGEGTARASSCQCGWCQTGALISWTWGCWIYCRVPGFDLQQHQPIIGLKWSLLGDMMEPLIKEETR